MPLKIISDWYAVSVASRPRFPLFFYVYFDRLVKNCFCVADLQIVNISLRVLS